MPSSFLAKSEPAETIQQHTQALEERYQQLYNYCKDKISQMSSRDWELLKWAVLYHDVGKYDNHFQSMLKQNSTNSFKRIRIIQHNFLSVLAIPAGSLKLNLSEQLILYQAVAYHHERNRVETPAEVAQIYQSSILPHKEQIEQELGIVLEAEVLPSSISKVLPSMRISHDKKPELYSSYLLIKGFLHRLDHAASAHVPVELDIPIQVGTYAQHYIVERLKSKLRMFQQFALDHQQDHVIMIAPTGEGKTEAGLIWAGNSKTFFTLPLRVSLNAMYKRIVGEHGIHFSYTSIDNHEDHWGEQAVGLLHSTSMEYLIRLDQEEQSNNGDQQQEIDYALMDKVITQSKQYANKLIISTIDQILQFPMYYLGYEKEYSVFAYSKLIIDELQLYDPRLAALIIRALVMIDEIGGSFMIMTATLPSFYYDELAKRLNGSSKRNIAYSGHDFIEDTLQRHYLKLHDDPIADEKVIAEIIHKGQQGKVLVICNTIAKATEVYEKIINNRYQVNPTNTESLSIYCQLLHSKFTQRDRAFKEDCILKFAGTPSNVSTIVESEYNNFEVSSSHGIWVTTQLVEASLDIDFDHLYSEMSSLDSQFQRYGRCNRKGQKSITDYNIHIYTGDVSGLKYVYDEEIYEYSVDLLQDYDGQVLLESQKQQMIEDLYSQHSERNFNFRKKFADSLYELENLTMYNTTSKLAKALFRDIQTVQVVPKQYKNDPEFKKSLQTWQKANRKKEIAKRQLARIQLEEYSLNINRYTIDRQMLSKSIIIPDLYYVDAPYDNQKGLRLNERSPYGQ